MPTAACHTRSGCDRRILYPESRIPKMNSQPSPSPTPPETVIYRTSNRYRLLIAVALVLAALFAWELWRVISTDSAQTLAWLGTLFFLAVSLGIGLWSLNAALVRLEVDETGVTLRAPLAADTRVEFRQLVAISQSGRFGNSLTLLYHPRQEDGLLNLDDARSLFLPGVTEQDALLATLEEKMPT